MDLIDRQAAIEAMMNASTPAFDKNGKPTFLVDYVSVMQNLPSAEPKTGHWIPVSERLPEDVLCQTLVTDGMDVWVETWVGIVGKWKYNHSAITAWMPLPEPWKGEDNGGSN